MKTLPILMALVLGACSAPASQEGILALSSFRLESPGIGGSGKVVVEGKQNERNRIARLKISAFGKDYSIPENKLAPLAGVAWNGVRISYEAGYAELGGRTIYVQFQTGFTSGTRAAALITLTEDGKVKVSGPDTKGAQRNGAANRSQPVSSEPNRTSSAARSGG
jgi:hypothetical protein